MTNSISSGSRSKLLGAVVVACAVLGVVGEARADRKRVVVLDFEGPKGDKFHDDLVKLIKKTHTVVPTDKWNGAAEELDAGTVSDKNVKKVARKLKIDAIVEGKIEKRRDEFIIRLRLRDGKSGGFVGASVDTKAEGPRIDGRAQRDIKDELLDAIGNVGSAWASAGDDEDERPAKKAAKKTDDEDERPAKKAAKKTDDEDERPVKKGFSRRSDDERGSDRVDRKSTKASDDEDEKLPAKKAAKADDDKPKKAAKAEDDKPKKTAKKADDDEDEKLPPKKTAKKADDDKPVVKLAAKDKTDDDELPRKASKAPSRDDGARPNKKKVAASDDDDTSTEVDAEVGPVDPSTALSPGERALDAVAGMSFTMRRMAFAYRSDLLAKPAGYKGALVAGGMIDATFYPLAFGHRRTDLLKNLGLNVMYDRVFKIDSRDPMTNIVHASLESRWGIAGVFRYPLTRSAVVAGTLGYTSQLFRITGPVDLPNVKYSIIAPGVSLRYQITSKILASADARFLLITNAGGIQDPKQYGDAKVLGFEGGFAVDYQLTHNIFARAAVRYESIALTFTGNGDQSTMRDGDPMTQDVSGAHDSYLGLGITAGYLY